MIEINIEAEFGQNLCNMVSKPLQLINEIIEINQTGWC